MSNKNNKIENNELFFFIAYGLYLFFALLNATFFSAYFPNKYIKLVMILCVIILIFKELLDQKGKIPYKELIYLVICLIMSLLIVYHLNKTVMIPFFFLIYSARKIKFEKIAKFTIVESVIIFIITIISAKLGIITNYTYINYYGRKREYLGFLYSLYPQMIMLNITALYLYIKIQKKSILKYIFFVAINYWIFLHTNSRLSFYLSLLLILLMFILNIKPNILKKRRIICFIMSTSFLVFSISSLYLNINYDSSNDNMVQLNKILENRLLLGYNSTFEYDINLFGNDVQFVGNGLDSQGNLSTEEYNYVDCLYLNVLEKYGLIFFIILLSLLTYTAFKIWKKNDYPILVILFILALHGAIDDLGIYLHYNTFWFIIGECFISRISNADKRTLAMKG